MKAISSILLAGSLALNAAFVYFYFSGSSEQPSVAANESAGKSSPDDALPTLDANIWPDLQAEQLPALVSHLRAAGFPAEMVRAIVSAQVSEAFAARRKALDPDAANRPYWKSRLPNPAVEVAQRQLSREQQKVLRDLLGKDADPDDPMSQAFSGRRTGHLPADKADEIKRVIREFDDQRQDLFAGGTFNMEREKMAALDKAQHDAIAKVLTPEELTDFDLRNSNTANTLRYELTAFNPTEEEFRALFALRKPFDEKFSMMYTSGPPSQEQMRLEREAQRQLSEQIKAALSPERAAEYERATDFNYRQTSLLVTRLELPPETTAQVYAVQKEIQQRVGSVYQDNPTPAQRNEALAALAEEAKTKISAVLGPKGFDAYKQYAGSWMQQLQPRPAIPGGTGAGGAAIRVTPRSGGD